MNVTIFFYDKHGNTKEEEMYAANMNELESNADLLAEYLEKQWGSPVLWRKLNKPTHTKDIIKVKIKPGTEAAFQAFLDEKGLYYKKVRYAKNLFIWRVDLPEDVDRVEIEALDYVLQVSNMETI